MNLKEIMDVAEDLGELVEIVSPTKVLDLTTEVASWTIDVDRTADKTITRIIVNSWEDESL